MDPAIPHDLFELCLSPTDSSTPVRFQAAITRAAGDMHVEAFSSLDVDDYEQLGRCKRDLLLTPRAVAVSEWGGPDEDRILTSIEEGFWRVSWREETLYMVCAKWREGFNETSRTWVVARSTELVNEFALDVARVTNDPRDAILVFHGSCWQRSHELYVATQQASFDDLILARSLKEQIRGDFQRFLGARSAYEDLGLAWRRGALFLGPPGNGKTHCLRALVRELNVPSLYVQSVKARYETEEANLKKVFDRARQLRPCVLVVEDIDALINGENRSFFLNQLDGFEKNVGLIVLATTNHPERIDPAILDRPSRFDRKYHFDLPESEERRAYLALWQTKLAGKLEWSAGTTEALVTRTVGFSFAYLKELVVAALMKSVSGDVSAFSVLLERECETLAAEMATRKTATTLLSATPTDVGDADDDD
jgi:AAA+ superfamily predicted ATPase